MNESEQRYRPILDLIPVLEASIAKRDLVELERINGAISPVFIGEIDRGYLKKNEVEFRKLYELIREAEALLGSLTVDTRVQQKVLNKKRKSSKSYRDIGKL